MKHPGSRALFAYWDARRGLAPAPASSRIDPAAIRPLLGDGLVLGCEPGSGLTIRLAGTRVRALFGRDICGLTFNELIDPQSRHRWQDLTSAATQDALPVVAGLTDAAAVIELLLLPVTRSRFAPSTMLGLLAPLAPAARPLALLTLTSWRVLDARGAAKPRSLRKRAIARGLVVYEGMAEG